MAERTFYDILSVSPSDPPEGIRAAYRAQMALYHPDKVASLGPDLQALAEERARELNQALEVLSDPLRRAAYDRSMAPAPQLPPAAAAVPPMPPPPSYPPEAPPAAPSPTRWRGRLQVAGVPINTRWAYPPILIVFAFVAYALYEGSDHYLTMSPANSLLGIMVFSSIILRAPESILSRREKAGQKASGKVLFVLSRALHAFFALCMLLVGFAVFENDRGQASPITVLAEYVFSFVSIAGGIFILALSCFPYRLLRR